MIMRGREGILGQKDIYRDDMWSEMSHFRAEVCISDIMEVKWPSN